MKKNLKVNYTDDWPQIALAVKETAGWHCQNCDHLHDPQAGYMLTVHHIDLNPQNNELWNIPALCQRCHLHYQKLLNLYQMSFFGYPPWILRYFTAIGLTTSHLKELPSSKLPARLDTWEKSSVLK